jgi:hypothetical protein
MRTVEAIIEATGEVRLIEPLRLPSPRRALVTILEEAPSTQDTALLSEAALAEDWNRPEEDAAWAHLQPAKSS